MGSCLRRLLLLPAALLTTLIFKAQADFLQARLENSTATPSPIHISPDPGFLGIDGEWSTITLRVGTPEQAVKTLVSTASYQTWVVLPVGCAAAEDQSACAEGRGDLFDNTTSSTFDYKGIYALLLERNLGLDSNAAYGFDAVRLGEAGDHGPAVKNTTVAAFALEVFYLGVFGLNPKPSNFSGFNDGMPSFMTQLREQNSIPSTSFGYTAGAKYRFSGVPNSLTLGGYDSAKFLDNNTTFIFADDNSRNLLVAIQSITTPSQTQDSPVATELLPSPIYAYIDSTVAGIWLPEIACQAFELEFGLTYDDDSQLYLVNDTLHQSLLDRDANITFTIAQNPDAGSTVQISLPYAAFDLVAQPPLPGLANSSRYFPIQRADNDTQYTLGRTFLQEAYISVDWDSSVFNVSQVLWSENSVQTLVPILATEANSNSGSSSDPSDAAPSLSPGAIAGISVGAVVVIGALVLVASIYYRRKRRTRDDEKSGAISSAAGARGSSNTHVYPKAELEGSALGPEHRRLLSANSSMTPGTPQSGGVPISPSYFSHGNAGSTSSTPGEGTWSSSHSGQLVSPSSASEADSRERRVYEMPGDMPTIKEKDGKALSEKEALRHRERVYNGVADESAPVTEGIREPRRVNPEDIVRADAQAVQVNAQTEPQDRSLRRAFSFELDSNDQAKADTDDDDLYE